MTSPLRDFILPKQYFVVLRACVRCSYNSCRQAWADTTTLFAFLFIFLKLLRLKSMAKSVPGFDGIQFASLFGFVLALYAYYVESKAVADPSYVASCDISAYISCSKVSLLLYPTRPNSDASTHYFFSSLWRFLLASGDIWLRRWELCPRVMHWICLTAPSVTMLLFIASLSN